MSLWELDPGNQPTNSHSFCKWLPLVVRWGKTVLQTWWHFLHMVWSLECHEYCTCLLLLCLSIAVYHRVKFAIWIQESLKEAHGACMQSTTCLVNNHQAQFLLVFSSSYFLVQCSQSHQGWPSRCFCSQCFLSLHFFFLFFHRWCKISLRRPALSSGPLKVTAERPLTSLFF